MPESLKTLALLRALFFPAWILFQCMQVQSQGQADHFTRLDESSPFYPNLAFPKLVTPQWVGEDGVEAVVILGIDDMRGNQNHYESYLRPILDRLKAIDGRAPVSIFCNALDPTNPHLQYWLQEGLSFEVHTLSHPCPILSKGNFQAASDTYHGGVELLNQIPHNQPVAFRTPCCDSINSPSPRVFQELLSQTNALGQFLSLDSSIMNLATADDPDLPKEWVTEEDGSPRFQKYLPFPSFTTTIENYPYPYLINHLLWEFPAVVPSDWEAQNIHGVNQPRTVDDWKRALDITLKKQGTFTLIFHPHGWIKPEQIVELIDYTQTQYPGKFKFLNFREAQNRINENLLSQNPVRNLQGDSNGIRLLDLNHDGYLDVLIGNEETQVTRVWNPETRRWIESPLPFTLTSNSSLTSSVRFGSLEPHYPTVALHQSHDTLSAWSFQSHQWNSTPTLLKGLEINDQPLRLHKDGIDLGARFRDLNRDDASELLLSNPLQSAIFTWDSSLQQWKPFHHGIPASFHLVDEQGMDAGLRFEDINGDGYDDLLFSNWEHFAFNLYVPELYLGFQAGWTRKILSGSRGDQPSIPSFVRQNAPKANGVWFARNHLWVQNEDTAHLPDLVDRRSYQDLLKGLTPDPKSPQESLQCFDTAPGFTVELVASEPLIYDPVAFDWGADGKLWVAEMGDYPLGPDGKGTAGGVIRFLEDTNQDGLPDQSTVFLEPVNFPSGIFPWKKGVIISAAPEVFYAEDTNGDGYADIKRVLINGFREGNQQHRVNGFEWGLDNWLYGANGDSGGLLTSLISGQTIDLRGSDFRFQPDSGALEKIEGQTQFGRRRDDWGNWFGNANPIWLWHYPFPSRYLLRNPHLRIGSLRHLTSNQPDAGKVFPLARRQQRYNDVGMEGYVTSANSPTPYRDILFGEAYQHSVFISEPVHQLVHHEVLTQDGVTFQSRRPATESSKEFLASSDAWFRPTQMKTGPDGALYIADMYRLVIEHPEWIPLDTQAVTDLRAGADKGRLYRVYPNGKKLSPLDPSLFKDSASQIKALTHSNGWVRDTAQRLLVTESKPSDPAPLQALALTDLRPETRLQALGVLHGLGALTPAIYLQAFNDPKPEIRKQALQWSEPLMKQTQIPTDLAEGWLRLAGDKAISVRFQAALSLGEWSDIRASAALAELALSPNSDGWIQKAVLTSAPSHLPDFSVRIFQAKSLNESHLSLLEHLLEHWTSPSLVARLDSILQTWFSVPLPPEQSWRLRIAARIYRLQRETNPVQTPIPWLLNLKDQARSILKNMSPSDLRLLDALPWLGIPTSDSNTDFETLVLLVQNSLPPPILDSVLDQVPGWSEPNRFPEWLRAWKKIPAETQRSLLGVWIRREAWILAFIQSAQDQSLPPQIIPLEFQQALQTHPNTRIQDSITAWIQPLVAQDPSVESIVQGIQNRRGDPEAGQRLFVQACASCHRFKEWGKGAGPDLASLQNQPDISWITAIALPSQAIEEKYRTVQVETLDEELITGFIIEESPNHLTLMNVAGLTVTLPKNRIRSTQTSSQSLMPEGFGEALSHQNFADLLEFLKR